MPKIVHMSSAHLPNDGRIFYKECCSLAALGYEVVYVVPKEADCLEAYTLKNNVKIKYIKKYRYRSLRFSLGLFAMLRSALKEKGDLYHFHDPDLIIAGIILALMRKKVVYDIHELYSSQIYIKKWVPFFLKTPLSYCISWIEKIGLKFFKGGVCAAPCVTEQFKNKKKLIECNNFPILYPALARSEPSIPTALYAGTVSKARGLMELIQIPHYFEPAELQLNIVGSFSEKSLYDEVSQLPEWQRIHYLPRVDFKKLPTLFSQASVGLALLHPTQCYFEVLPTKIFEYMMASLPIVVSNFPALSQFIAKNKCGLCADPLNPKEIADALRYLIEHPQEAKEMGLRGRYAVEKNYQWASEAVKLNGLYQEILR